MSEKVRIVFGLKRLAWRSVEIPRLLPKPKLVILTGGYRRTPVLQCGADIYCDTQCIIRELERRYPHPTLFPDNNESRAWMLSRWIDDSLLKLILALVLGSEVEKMPREFIADRGRLYFGPNHDLNSFNKRLPDLESQLRPQLDWVQDFLAGRTFMHGSAPGLLDAYVYFILWFFRDRYPNAEAILSRVPQLGEWEQRVRAHGHGSVSDLDADEAIAIARDAVSGGESFVDPDDPMQLQAGRAVSVAPDGEGGDPAVTGRLFRLDRHQIAIRRQDPGIGEVTVYFPRIGYRLDC